MPYGQIFPKNKFTNAVQGYFQDTLGEYSPYFLVCNRKKALESWKWI